MPAACLMDRRAEMFRGGRRGELSSLAGEQVVDIGQSFWLDQVEIFRNLS